MNEKREVPAEEEVKTVVEKSTLAERRLCYSVARKRGLSVPEACRSSGLSSSTAYDLERRLKSGDYDKNADFDSAMGRQELINRLSFLIREGPEHGAAQCAALLCKIEKWDTGSRQEEDTRKESLIDWIQEAWDARERGTTLQREPAPEATTRRASRPSSSAR